MDRAETPLSRNGLFFVIFQPPQNWVAAERISFKLVTILDVRKQVFFGLCQFRQEISSFLLRHCGYLFREPRKCNVLVLDSTGACKFRRRISLCCLFHWQSGFHPALLAFGIVRHIPIAHRRQFTGSVFAGVSMIVRAVRDDLGILVGQQLWREFPDLFGRDVQRAGEMGFSIAFRREGLDYRDSLLLVEFRLQVFGRNCAVHFDLLRMTFSMP